MEDADPDCRERDEACYPGRAHRDDDAFCDETPSSPDLLIQTRFDCRLNAEFRIAGVSLCVPEYRSEIAQILSIRILTTVKIILFSITPPHCSRNFVLNPTSQTGLRLHCCKRLAYDKYNGPGNFPPLWRSLCINFVYSLQALAANGSSLSSLSSDENL